MRKKYFVKNTLKNLEVWKINFYMKFNYQNSHLNFPG